jgi:hypothetical protein
MITSRWTAPSNYDINMWLLPFTTYSRVYNPNVLRTSRFGSSCKQPLRVKLDRWSHLLISGRAAPCAINKVAKRSKLVVYDPNAVRQRSCSDIIILFPKPNITVWFKLKNDSILWLSGFVGRAYQMVITDQISYNYPLNKCHQPN